MKKKIQLEDILNTKEAQDVLKNMVKNGLGGALGFPGGGGFGWPNNPWSEQLSDPTTIFKNLRWFLLSNYRQVLSEAYVELPLLQTLVDVPVNDALRGGITIKSQELDEDEIKELQISLARDNDLGTIGYAAKWNRLFGGAGIMAIVDQDPLVPFDPSLITEDADFEIRAADMWELTWETQNVGGYNPSTQETDFDFYNYYGERIHNSYVKKLRGLQAPSFIRPRLRGWGFSIAEGLVRSLNQYLKATDLTFEVLDEFKVDVYRVKNLVNTLVSPTGQQQVRERFQEANWLKNYQNAIVMDSEDEYQQKQLSFSGLAEVMQGIRMQVASDMRFPMVKLFGTPATGLGADDESSIEVYNMMVESEVRSKIAFDIVWVLELKCQKLFGYIPEDIEIEFKPLRELSAVDTETVKTQIFTRLFQAKTAGELSTFEFRDACNKGNLLPIVLDTKGDELNPNDPEILTMLEEGTAAEEDPNEEKEPKKVQKNSLAFEKEAYTSDGGDTQYDSRRASFFEKNPLGSNKYLWEAAGTVARQVEGVEKWKFRLWYYKKHGGTFSNNLSDFNALPDKEHNALREKFQNPGKVDESKWKKAKEKSQEEYGSVKYAFVTYLYKKYGGTFG